MSIHDIIHSGKADESEDKDEDEQAPANPAPTELTEEELGTVSGGRRGGHDQPNEEDPASIKR